MKKVTIWTIEQIKIQNLKLERVSPSLMSFYTKQKKKYENAWKDVNFDFESD